MGIGVLWSVHRKEEQTKGICMAMLQFVAYCNELKRNNKIQDGKHKTGLC